MKRKFKITGMSCSACQAHVNKAVLKLNVNDVNVNLLTNSMEVDFDVDDINESLTDMIMRCTKFTMLNDDVQYKDIELALPDGF